MQRGEQVESNFVLIGLDYQDKQRHFASKLARSSEGFDCERTLSQLKRIRKYALANQASLRERFTQQVSRKGHSRIYSAKDAADAFAYIDRVLGKKKLLAINEAGVIGELLPYFESSNYSLINTYLAGYPWRNNAEKALSHYWQLPNVSAETAFGSFSVQRLRPSEGRKDYTALLGVCAAASEDGTICFLQHTNNVGMMLQEAHRLILIVGLEKIVCTREEALFQTKCMGAFGLESVILDLKLPKQSTEASELEDLPWSISPPDIHIILLNNGRSEIVKNDEFAELLTCISCRACAKHCPTHSYFNPDLGSYPKQYLWSFLNERNQSLDLCMGCGMCQQQCPLDIDIPYMISRSRNKSLVKWRHSLKNRIFQDTWLFMYLAHLFAPMTNGLLKNRSTRKLLEKLIGFQQEAWVPEAHRTTFVQWVRRQEPGKER
jgi:L-lactate utilization protein LutB